MNHQSKIDYDAHQKEMAITYSVVETAKFEGRQEGRQEGEFNKTKEIVLNSFKNGIYIIMISTITGLSVDEIKALLEKES